MSDAVIAFVREQGLTLAIGRQILTVQQVFGEIFNEGPRFARDGSRFDHMFDDGVPLERTRNEADRSV